MLEGGIGTILNVSHPYCRIAPTVQTPVRGAIGGAGMHDR